MNRLSLFVPGTPIPQGSMHSPKAGLVLHSNEDKMLGWRDLIQIRAKEAWRGPLIEGPVQVQAWFYFERPKRGHKGERYKATTPDTDKLLRCLFDALTGVVYKDDKQVAYVMASKEWEYSDSKGPGVYFEVGKI